MTGVDGLTWTYTVKIGPTTHGPWVAQILNDAGEEVAVIIRPSLKQAIGEAATAIMDVEDEMAS